MRINYKYISLFITVVIVIAGCYFSWNAYKQTADDTQTAGDTQMAGVPIEMQNVTKNEALEKKEYFDNEAPELDLKEFDTNIQIKQEVDTDIEIKEYNINDDDDIKYELF